MSEKVMSLEIVTPSGLAYSGEVSYVGLCGVLGQMGILPGHEALLSMLEPGLSCFDPAEEGGRRTYLVTGPGFAEVCNDKISVLVELCEQSDNLKLEEVKEKAEPVERSAMLLYRARKTLAEKSGLL